MHCHLRWQCVRIAGLLGLRAKIQKHAFMIMIRWSIHENIIGQNVCLIAFVLTKWLLWDCLLSH